VLSVSFRSFGGLWYCLRNFWNGGKNMRLWIAAIAVVGLQLGWFTTALAEDVPGVQEVTKLKSIIADPGNFIEGNLYFIAYHEIAHALVSEFDLPVVGREEDAADRLAILLMTPEEGKGEPDYLVAAMQGWFSTAVETPLSEIAWWDEHGADLQRGYQISCLLYGADAKRFTKIAKAVDLPEDRQETCVTESEQNQRSWNGLLESHWYPDGEGQPAGSIPVIYEKTKTYADQEKYLRDAKLLEDISEFMSTNYRFEKGIKITAKECGEANAYWNGEDRELIYCYELVQDFQRLAEK
jgi:hypothetical protein